MPQRSIKMARSQYDYFFKLVLVGEPSVGKSRVFSRYMNEDFTDKPTVGK